MKIEKQEPVQTIISDEPEKTQHTKQFPMPFFILMLAIGALVVITVLTYKLPITNPFVRTVSSIIPYPAATLNYSIITLSDYTIEYDALMNYLKTTKTEDTPSDDVVRQMILDALVNKSAIRALATKYGVKLDRDRIEKYYSDVVSGEGSEAEFEKQLHDSFGWNKTQFKHRIIESIVLALQMSEYISADKVIQDGQRAHISDVYARLKNGEDFATVAKEVNSEMQTPIDGDLGYQSVSSLPEEWSAAKDIPVGGLTDVLESDQGYAVFTVADRIESADDTRVHLMAIMVTKKTLEDVAKEYITGAKIRYFVK